MFVFSGKPLDPHPDYPLHRWLRLNPRSVADIHPRQDHLLQASSFTFFKHEVLKIRLALSIQIH